VIGCGARRIRLHCCSRSARHTTADRMAARRILRLLQLHLSETCTLWGYDISPSEGPSANEKASQFDPCLFIQSLWHGVRYPWSSDNRTDAQPLVQFKFFGNKAYAHFVTRMRNRFVRSASPRVDPHFLGHRASGLVPWEFH
jgi:hypothetical protein